MYSLIFLLFGKSAFGSSVIQHLSIWWADRGTKHVMVWAIKVMKINQIQTGLRFVALTAAAEPSWAEEAACVYFCNDTYVSHDLTCWSQESGLFLTSCCPTQICPRWVGCTVSHPSCSPQRDCGSAKLWFRRVVGPEHSWTSWHESVVL